VKVPEERLGEEEDGEGKGRRRTSRLNSIKNF
jgi:hypothetical protein